MTVSNTLEKVLNRDFVVAAVAEKLTQFSIIDDNQEITNIQFGELFRASDTEFVPCKIFLTTRVEQESEPVKEDA